MSVLVTILLGLGGALIGGAVSIVTNLINSRDNRLRLEREIKSAQWKDEMSFRREQQRAILDRRIAPKATEIAALEALCRTAYKTHRTIVDFGEDSSMFAEAKLEFANLAGHAYLHTSTHEALELFVRVPRSEEFVRQLVDTVKGHIGNLNAEIAQLEEDFAETKL